MEMEVLCPECSRHGPNNEWKNDEWVKVEKIRIDTGCHAYLRVKIHLKCGHNRSENIKTWL